MAITTSLWFFVVSKHKSTWSCYFSSRIETDPFHLCCFHHNDANSIRITFYVYRDPYYQHALNSVPAGISNHTLSKLWVKIIHPFPNSNGSAIQAWELISNFISHDILERYNYLSMPGLTLYRIDNRGSRSLKIWCLQEPFERWVLMGWGCTSWCSSSWRSSSTYHWWDGH